MGCANDHPTPLDFKHRKRWYVLEKHFTSVFTRNRNTTDNNEEEHESRTNENDCATANMVKSINVSGLINDGTQSDIDNNADNNTNAVVFQ
ncbi:hypothetical protein PR048_010084 [Dryococelus australis]|uniref:Uncharacterized protein n=1 Tax=Dryococelus australis TaxID=614101 RepID=A0ABQ9I2T3_9NEOP|nr:hypothetical protein PR048_010084 [Dryococelus australis]